ncbi:MAG TPA: ABC-F family ATP-binding cassette domain-containing protein [Candidatus Saccharimonadales bacterium]|nr:ABC-F family ATP-binding cassette domain-containing protein [Candidatus Saccharimonadales bacterium]
MIFIKNLELQFGKQIVFDDISCTLSKQDRVGLVGRNGTGKSTLLKVIAGDIGTDGGDIDIQRGSKIAYMPQEVVIVSEKNVLDETLATFTYLYDMAQEKIALDTMIAKNPTSVDMNRYGEIEHELLEHNFDSKKAQAQKILAGLGFDEKKQVSKVSQLSVGWRMRVVLAKLLLQDADFYLFDEPTNHLDLPSKNWFLQFLKEGSFGYLLVCHDRYFLDQACNKTFELSLGKLTVYHGNYSIYLEQKKMRTEHLQQAYEQQQREIKHKQSIIDRFRASATKSAMAQSMIKSLDKIERIELERKPKTMTLKLQPPVRSGQHVLTVKDVAYSFDHELFKNVSFEIQRGDKVALIAPNGTGKSTLFNLIAGKLKLQKGSIEFGHNVISALFDQDQEKILDPHKTVVQEVTDACPNITEAQIRATLGSFLFSGDDVKKLTKVLSGGERNRVAMSKIILSKANFFLLDEPTNHLDIESKEVILNALTGFDGTILFVSHDQYFTNQLATKILELTPQGVTLYFGNYENYVSTKESTESSHKPKEIKVTQVSTAQLPKIDKKELYLLQKKAKNVRNKIGNLEKQIPTLLAAMGIATYGSDEYNKLQQDLNKAQADLASSTKDWEEMQKQIESVS